MLRYLSHQLSEFDASVATIALSPRSGQSRENLNAPSLRFQERELSRVTFDLGGGVVLPVLSRALGEE